MVAESPCTEFGHHFMDTVKTVARLYSLSTQKEQLTVGLPDVQGLSGPRVSYCSSTTRTSYPSGYGASSRDCVIRASIRSSIWVCKFDTTVSRPSPK